MVSDEEQTEELKLLREALCERKGRRERREDAIEEIRRLWREGRRRLAALFGVLPESPAKLSLRGANRRCSVTHVASIPKATELASLSVSDRLDLMDEIWVSLAPDADALPLPDWHVAEIKRRL